MINQTDKAFTEQFEQRKKDHITLALNPENEALGYNGLEAIELIHNALPDIDFETVDISTTLLGQKQSSPFFVSSMTAGHKQGILINSRLAEACQTMDWLMGVGSQRKQLMDEGAYMEWHTIKKQYPKVKLLGNLGLSQLIDTPTHAVQKILDPLEAVGIFIHTNPLQECLQPEGTPNFKGGLKALERLCREMTCPVILKETGCGFSQSTLKELKNIGLYAVDLSGYGGTHWGRIEGARAVEDPLRHRAAQTFKTWGINTLDSLFNALSCQPDYHIWASGGIRSGLEAAKLIALGSEGVGLALPMLKAALEGTETLITAMAQYQFELKMSLFCTGHANIPSFQENKIWLKKTP